MNPAPPAAGQTPKPKRRGPLFGWAVAAFLGFALGFVTGIQVSIYVITHAQSAFWRDNMIAGSVQTNNNDSPTTDRAADATEN